MRSTVLVVTSLLDPHADAVIVELNKRRVPVFRFHTDTFPRETRLTLSIDGGSVAGSIANPWRTLSLDTVRSIWYRRPEPPTFDDRLDPDARSYAELQARNALSSLYSVTEGLWVNDPFQLRRAEAKALQLREAARSGLTTPKTMIANDGRAMRQFVRANGGTGCALKPLNVAGISNESGFRMPFTHRISAPESLVNAELAPSILQSYVDKALEVRCVVLGERVFAAAIRSQAGDLTRDDWRRGDADLEPIDLPEDVAGALVRLVARLGLVFATPDLILTPDGRFVFLELNPNGQWLWLEFALGLPLTEAFADILDGSASPLPA